MVKQNGFSRGRNASQRCVLAINIHYNTIQNLHRKAAHWEEQALNIGNEMKMWDLASFTHAIRDNLGCRPRLSGEPLDPAAHIYDLVSPKIAARCARIVEDCPSAEGGDIKGFFDGLMDQRLSRRLSP